MWFLQAERIILRDYYEGGKEIITKVRKIAIQRKETPEQAVAFAAYYAMGRDRSLKKLSQRYPKVIPNSKKPPSFGTLKKWSRWFSWGERIIIKDKAVAAGIEKKTTKAAIDRRAKYLELVEMLIDSSYDRDSEGNVKLKIEIEKPKDFREAVELALRLIGEPEKQEIEHTIKLYDFDAKNYPVKKHGSSKD